MSLDLGSASATIELNVGQFVKNANVAGDALQNLQQRSETAGKGMMGWVDQNSQNLTKMGGALTVFGAATTAIMGVGVKTAMDFEAQMSAVAAVSGASAEQMERAADVVKELGYETTLSASETAAALEELIKAGVSFDDALDGVLASVISLSEATGTDLLQSTETVAAAMNIFGYEADEATRVVDAMSQSANASALDINDWMLALKYSGPIVSALGWEIEDLAEMMIILGDSGIKGEQGATAMRNILTGLASATPELTAQFAEYGVALYDVNGDLRDMNDITTDLAASWANMSEKQKIDFAQLVAGEQGMSSFMIIMEAQTQAVNEGGDAFDRAGKRMKAAGTTAEAAKKRMDNLAGSVEELKGTVETLMISFMSGLTPVIRRATDALSGVLQMFLKLPEPVQQGIAAVTGITGVLALLTGGGILAAVKIAELASSFKLLTNSPTVIAGMTKAVTALRVAMLGLFTNPLILGGALVIGALFAAYKTNFLNFADGVDGAIGKLRDFGKFFFGIPESKAIGITLDTSLTGEEDAWSNWTKMPDGSYKHATLGITSHALDGTVTEMIDPATGEKSWNLNVDLDNDGSADALKVIDSVNEGNGKYILTVEIDGQTYQAWYNEVTGETIIIPAKVELDTGDSKSRIREIFEDGPIGAMNVAALGVAIIMDKAFQRIQGAWDATVQHIKGAWDSFGQWVMGSWQSLSRGWESVTDKVSKIWGTVTGELGGIWDAFVTGGFAEGVSAIGETISTIVEGVQSFVEGAISSIESVVATAGDGIEWLVSLVPEALGGPGDKPAEDDAASGSDGVTRTVRPRRDPNLAGSSEGNPFIDKVSTNIAIAAWQGYTAALNEAIIASNLMASSTQTTDIAVMGASQSIAGAGASIGGTFGTIAADVAGRSMEASNAAVTSFITMQTGVGASMGAIAGNVLTHSAAAASSAIAQFSALRSSVAERVAALQANVGTKMGALAGIVASQSTSANTNATTQFSSMAVSAAGYFLGMQASAAVQMALMASTATTQGNATMSNMVGALAGGMARVYATLMGVVSAVSSVGGAAASTAYSIGANISSSFASGMYAYMGSIAAAAASMVATASAALRAKAMISSPSRLFRHYGEYVGEGFELGILRSIPDIQRASAAMVGASLPSPAFNSPLRGGYGGGTQIIDNSTHTHTTEYVALTESDFQRLLAKADRGDAAHGVLSDPRGFKQYGRVR